MIFTVSKITSSFVNMVFALGALVIVFVVCRVVPNVFLSIYSGNSSARNICSAWDWECSWRRGVYSSAIYSIFITQY